MTWGSNVFPLLIITSGGKFTGLFVYSPAPGPGNLIASTAAHNGTDPFGNAFLQGEVVYGTGGLGVTAMQLTNAGIVWWTAATEAGPWTQPGTDFPNIVLFEASSGANNAWFANVQSSFAIGIPSASLEAWVHPSGDTTGATDTAAITAAFSAANTVHLLPGAFYTNAPIQMNHDFQVLAGAGQPYATAIQSAAISAQPAMIVASGATAPLNAVTIRDLALKGNANSGHGIIFRSNNGLIQNVNVQGSPGGDCFHLSLDALTPTLVFDITMINCYALQPGSTFNGYLIDGNYDSCELILCRGQGGTGPSAPGATWGIQCLAGSSQIKLTDCHMFEFTNGGAVFLGTGYQVVGGEYETNGVGAGAGFGVGIRAASTCLQLRVIGASFYGNNANDIQEQAGADHNVYYGNTIESGTGVTLTGTHSTARDNVGYNPVGHLTAPAYVAGSPATNTFGVVVTVYVAGSTAVAVDGVATGLAAGTFQLEPGETITPTGAGGSWVWFGQ